MTVNRRLSVALFFLVVLAAMPTAEAKTYVSHDGYQISTPDNWTTKPGPGDNKVTMTFFCSTGKNGHPELPIVEVMTRPQEAMTMKKLADLGPWMMQGTFPGFRQSSMSSTLLDGVPAYDVKGTYLRAGRTIFVRELFVIHDGEAYMITTACPAEKRVVYAPLSNQVIDTIRWR